jgi:hypothetical protein
MLTNGAVVARLHRRGACLREPLHQADIGAPPPWRGFTVPLPGWRGGDSGPPWINLRRLPSVAPGRALAVRWERWVPVSVSFGSRHADQPFCSKISIYLEPRYGIEP